LIDLKRYNKGVKSGKFICQLVKKIKHRIGTRSASRRFGREGFTVVEMLVVLGVTSVLASMFVSQSGVLRDQVVLFREEAQVIQSLFKAKTYSIQVLAEEEGGNKSGCGYGVFFENMGEELNGKYTIYFRKRNLDGTCPSGEEIKYNETTNTVVKSVNNIDSKIFIRGDSAANFVFIPPYPEIFIDRESNKDGKIFLCLKSQTDFCRGVEVNKVGQITSKK